MFHLHLLDVEDVPTNYEASMNNMIEPDPKGLNVGINIVVSNDVLFLLVLHIQFLIIFFYRI